jgi:hypothetical protein
MSTVRNYVRDHYPHALIADGHDKAMLGVLVRPGRPAVVVYDVERVIDDIVEDGVTRLEAEEFVDFNIVQAHVGPATPLFVRVESRHERS